MKKFIHLLLFCIPFASLSEESFSQRRRMNQPKDENQKPKVFIEKLNKQQFMDSAKYFGTLIPATSKPVFAPIESVVEKLNKKAGQLVSAGEKITILKSTSLDYGINQTVITAPIDGVISEMFVEENMLIARNTKIFEVMKPDFYKVSINVIANDAKVLKDLKKVNITIDNQTYSGTIDFISPTLDKEAGTQEAMILTEKITNQNPGKIVQVNFSYNQRENFAINKLRVKSDKEGFYLQHIDSQSKVARVSVQVGKKDGEIWEVSGKDLTSELKVIGKSTSQYLQVGDNVEIAPESSLSTEKSGSIKSNNKKNG